MFSEVRRQESRRWKRALLASFVFQSGLLLILLHRQGAQALLPSEVALGTRGSSGSVIYLAPLGPELASAAERPQLPRKAPTISSPRPPKPIDRQREAPNVTAANAPVETAHGGSPWGSHVPGTPLTGPEVQPALPEVFPDPPVSRSDIPSGIQGDVIVEVTIDQQGNVVEEKLLQGIGYGVEEKVLAVLRQWHFRPATQNGVTIASQHIVHFHYPS